jgi:DNA topoisomerase-3
MVKVCLNVAEKPSVAKGVTQILSNGSYRTNKGVAKYNMNYEFNHKVEDTDYKMIFTSVLGHMMSLSYPETLSNWSTTNFDLLYTTRLNIKI